MNAKVNSRSTCIELLSLHSVTNTAPTIIYILHDYTYTYRPILEVHD